jgi:hypothetical protein
MAALWCVVAGIFYFKMFCHLCGTKGLETAKFSHSCGREFNLKADEPKLSGKKVPGKKAKGSTASGEAEEVTIQIGVMAWKDGELTTKRGSSLPLKAASDATADVLKAKAVAKQNRFNATLVKSDRVLGYKLLYPDKSEVLNEFSWQKYLEFTLAKYKEELGKPYSRISFLVCSNIDYLSYVADGVSDDSSENGEKKSPTSASNEVNADDYLKKREGLSLK